MTIKPRAVVSGPLPETVWDSAPRFSRPRPWTELEYLALATITVLTLTDAAYIPYGIFRRGETADARLLTGFTVAVDVVLDAALA